MQEDVKVSVLIPLYNAESYVGETIDSLLNQSWKNLEVIVVDDGSIDKSAEIVSGFDDKRIKLIRKNNEGASIARNVAFEHSDGDYIQYLDADDILNSYKIESQIKLLENTDGKCISSSNWGRFRKSIDETVPEKQFINQDLEPVDWLVEAWTRGEMMQTACWLSPRNLIAKSGIWDPNLSIADDGEFFSRVILSSEKILFSDEAFVHYRSELNESLSKNYSASSVKEYLRQLKLYQDHILKVEDSKRVRTALCTNFQEFAYRFYSSYPELAKESLSHIKALDIHILDGIGGKKSRLLSSIIGFENMLKLRKVLSSIL